MPLLCDRPLARNADFNVARLVVSTVRGLNVNGQHLEMGDEVPSGVLTARALQQEYEPPLRSIELIDFAFKIPSLREACLQRGVVFNPDEVQAPVPEPEPLHAKIIHPDPDSLSRSELAELCRVNGLSDAGSWKQLRKRVAELG